MAGLNLLAQISDTRIPSGVYNCVHGHILSLLALGFTHHKGFSYQIIELEDSGLPQQGILPISARKTITKATDVCLEKTLLTVPRANRILH